MTNTPRVLIVSNECLAENSSNGRTMRNFLLGWPKEHLAQFYTKPGTPDFSVCGQFYCVTDADVLRSLKRPHAVQGRVEQKPDLAEHVSKEPDLRRKYGKNPWTVLVRTAVWNLGLWESKDFNSWLEAFRPEVVLLQAGDSPFMFALAEKIADRFRAKLVIYNSEAYYFKTVDYMRSTGIPHRLYPLLRQYFRRQFRKTMRRTQHMVVNSEPLRARYAAEFDVPLSVLYTVSELPVFPVRQTDGFSVLYAGNLGVGRVEPLLEVADALQAISPARHLDVYGSTRIPEDELCLKRYPGIRYHGAVPYETVKHAMLQSDLLIHAENFGDFYAEDLQYAFSTKIADALACGRPFLLYAPENLVCTAYLREHRAAWIAVNPEELSACLRELVQNPDARLRYRVQAAAVAAKNHTAAVNAEKFQQILRQV